MGFLKGCYGSSMVVLWDFHWILMGFLMVFLCCFYDISMGFLLDSCGISIGLIFLWDHYSNSHGISLWFLCYSFAKVFLLLPKLSSLVSFI